MTMSDDRSRAHSVYTLFIYSNGRGTITYVAEGLSRADGWHTVDSFPRSLFFNRAPQGNDAATIKKDMYDDLKEAIILLMQHPITHSPVSNLSNEEQEKAFDLLKNLTFLSVDENYTLLDYIQMARLEYALGEVSYITTCDTDRVINHFRSALQYLEKGGLDLSINKWTQLVSLRTKEDME